MKVIKNADVFIFQCDMCGCVFKEAANRTRIATEAIWQPEKNAHGVRMGCPDCGNDVIGIRRNEEYKENPDALQGN